MGSYPPIVLKNPTKITPKVKVNVDSKDQIILQSAVNAKVKYFVTGNTKDFSVENLKKIYKIEIISKRRNPLLRIFVSNCFNQSFMA